MRIAKDTIKSHENIQLRKSEDATVYYYTYDKGRFIAAGFSGKRNKSDFYLSFSNIEQLSHYVREYFKQVTRRKEEKEAYRLSGIKRKQEAMNTVEVGTIFYNSYGYEQTNINYYQVVRKTKSSIVIRKIESEIVDTPEWAHDYVMPVKDAFIGEEIRKMPSLYGGFSMRCGSLSRWNGKPKLQTSYY